MPARTLQAAVHVPGRARAPASLRAAPRAASRAWAARALLLLALVPAAARAEEPSAATPAAQLSAAMDLARESRDAGAWAGHLARLGELWPEASEADRKLLATQLGHAFKAREEPVQQAALAAAVATKDGEAAWKAGLKALLPDAKDEAAGALAMRALQAVRSLAPDAAIGTLQGLLEKAKDPQVAAGAFEALGGYERSKQRVAILEGLVKVLRLQMPSSGGGQGGKNPSGPSPRWKALEPKALPALNALTGQRVGTLEAWLQLHDENKKKPAVLFTSPLD
ncbi:MAG: hypothetical protein ACKOSS_03010 [Planctomycetia bacterium]